MSHTVKPQRTSTTFREASRTINDGGNKITFDFTHTSAIKITTLSEDGHACEITLTTREWYLLEHLRNTIQELHNE